MKIKKIATSIGIVGRIFNKKSSSNKDTYSSAFLNNHTLDIDAQDGGSRVNFDISRNEFNMSNTERFTFRMKGSSPNYQSFKLKSYTPNSIRVSGGGGNYTQAWIDINGLKPNTKYVISYKITENTTGFNINMTVENNGISDSNGNLSIGLSANNGGTVIDTSKYVTFSNIQLEKDYQTEYKNFGDGTIKVDDISQFHRNTFSTDEICIGTWLGKPLYRRTFNITSPSQITSSEPILILGSDCSIVKYDGFLNTANKGSYPLNCWFSSTDYIYSYVTDSNVLRLKVSLENYANRPITVTLEYTKTTD